MYLVISPFLIIFSTTCPCSFVYVCVFCGSFLCSISLLRFVLFLISKIVYYNVIAYVKYLLLITVIKLKNCNL